MRQAPATSGQPRRRVLSRLGRGLPMLGGLGVGVGVGIGIGIGVGIVVGMVVGVATLAVPGDLRLWVGLGIGCCIGAIAGRWARRGQPVGHQAPV